MRVKITETGVIRELSLIDPKTGVNWICDLMGNDLPDYDADNDYYPMSQASANWWSDYTAEYQAADNRYHELLSRLDGSDYDELIELMDDTRCNADMEDYPEQLQAICDGAERGSE